MKLEQVHIVVSGVVQGVGFRYHAQKTAEKLGLCGWVKNLPNGNVEAIAEGPAERLSAFLQWCHQGPAQSHVDKVEVLERSGVKQPSFKEFEIKR